MTKNLALFRVSCFVCRERAMQLRSAGTEKLNNDAKGLYSNNNHPNSLLASLCYLTPMTFLIQSVSENNTYNILP